MAVLIAIHRGVRLFVVCPRSFHASSAWLSPLVVVCNFTAIYHARPAGKMGSKESDQETRHRLRWPSTPRNRRGTPLGRGENTNHGDARRVRRASHDKRGTSEGRG